MIIGERAGWTMNFGRKHAVLFRYCSKQRIFLAHLYAGIIKDIDFIANFTRLIVQYFSGK